MIFITNKPLGAWGRVPHDEDLASGHQSHVVRAADRCPACFSRSSRPGDPLGHGGCRGRIDPTGSATSQGRYAEASSQGEVLAAIRAVGSEEGVFGSAIAKRLIESSPASQRGRRKSFPSARRKSVRSSNLSRAGEQRPQSRASCRSARSPCATTSRTSARSCAWSIVRRRVSARDAQLGIEDTRLSGLVTECDHPRLVRGGGRRHNDAGDRDTSQGELLLDPRGGRHQPRVRN